MLRRSLALTITLLPAVAMAGTPEYPKFSQDELAQLNEDQQGYYAWQQDFLASLNYQDGTITLPGGIAQIEVPADYYYLSPEDAEKVLTDGWGNVPSNELSWGMIFPVDYHPLHSDAYGVTINYQNDGHVKDADAHKVDYDELLTDMQADTHQANAWRLENGYESIELIGWASQPYFDESAKTLHWAKALQFGKSEGETLNYNVRLLGREGVLVLNFIADMSQLAQVNGDLPDVLAMPSFTVGNTYADFDPKLDTVAAYGIGGLVAGKVLAKTGMLAIIIALFKKFGIFIVVAIAGGAKALFGRKKAKSEQ